MRDGDAGLVDAERDWARSVFSSVLFPEEDRRPQFSFGSTGAAFAGLIHSLDAMPVREEHDLLLRAVCVSGATETEYLSAPLSVLYAKSPNALKSVLRCAIAKWVYVRNHWGVSEEEFAALETERKQALTALRQAELIWLSGEGDEPNWPDLPDPMVRIRRGIRIGSRSLDDEEIEPLKSDPLGFDADNAASWINAVRAALPDGKAWLVDAGCERLC